MEFVYCCSEDIDFILVIDYSIEFREKVDVVFHYSEKSVGVDDDFEWCFVHEDQLVMILVDLTLYF